MQASARIYGRWRDIEGFEQKSDMMDGYFNSFHSLCSEQTGLGWEGDGFGGYCNDLGWRGWLNQGDCYESSVKYRVPTIFYMYGQQFWV